jgi:NAD(P)H-dependent FMN reductase
MASPVFKRKHEPVLFGPVGDPGRLVDDRTGPERRFMVKLQVVIASTREERVGPTVAAWVVERARAQGKFDVELVDLKEVNLPLLDEPEHPRFRKYKFEHTKAWSARVQSADAFVFVVPEYNYAMPPALLNALDYLSVEWNYKAAAMVSYGGISGGLRSAQMARQVLTSLRMMPIPEGVAIPFFRNLIGADGRFNPGELQENASGLMLSELARWSEALAPLRGPAAG